MAKLTVRDVAEEEAVSERTILNWVDRKILTPAYRVGKVIRFTREGVRRDLESATSGPRVGEIVEIPGTPLNFEEVEEGVEA